MPKNIFYLSQRQQLPSLPGVYFFYGGNDNLLYIGKAKNIRFRVNSYFSGPLFPKTAAMVSQIKKIKVFLTESEIDALLLEAELIKKYQPRYNSELKDDKSYLRIKIKDGVIKTVHHELDPGARYFGPFPEGNKVKAFLRQIRKIFPYRSHHHRPGEICFRAQIGLCPCQSKQNNLPQIIRLLTGKRVRLVFNLKKKMEKFSQKQNFEEALRLKKQIEALAGLPSPRRPLWEYETNPNLVMDQNRAKIKELCRTLTLRYKKNFRIEGYDVSHFSGKEVVASMVVFVDGIKNLTGYRRFKIKQEKNDDAAAITEVLSRRLKHLNWPKPDLILLDGPCRIINKIPIIGLEKRRETIALPNNKRITLPQSSPALNLLREVRDEAHRFAQSYHHLLQKKKIV